METSSILETVFLVFDCSPSADKTEVDVSPFDLLSVEFVDVKGFALLAPLLVFVVLVAVLLKGGLIGEDFR